MSINRCTTNINVEYICFIFFKQGSKNYFFYIKLFTNIYNFFFSTKHKYNHTKLKNQYKNISGLLSYYLTNMPENEF